MAEIGRCKLATHIRHYPFTTITLSLPNLYSYRTQKEEKDANIGRSYSLQTSFKRDPGYEEVKQSSDLKSLKLGKHRIRNHYTNMRSLSSKSFANFYRGYFFE